MLAKSLETTPEANHRHRVDGVQFVLIGVSGKCRSQNALCGRVNVHRVIGKGCSTDARFFKEWAFFQWFATVSQSNFLFS